jgi:hypothetical protein
MKENIKYGTIVTLAILLLALCGIYWEKDSYFFSDGPPIGYILTFNVLCY